MFKGDYKTNFYKLSKRYVSSNRHHTRFDIHLDWLTSFASHRSISLARTFALINLGLFAYVNLRSSWESRFTAIDSLSHSLSNQQFKEYVSLFTSQMGSRRIDDMVIETGILWTLGHYLEKLHSRPFMVKMFLFTFYIGFLNSLFWVRRDKISADRYAIEHPTGMRYVPKNGMTEPKYMSQHGLAMSLVYFSLFKMGFRFMILPIAVADLYIWGPYYNTGILTGLAAGMIL
jgi:hypothetical protein